MLGGRKEKRQLNTIGIDIYLTPGRVYMKARSIFKNGGNYCSKKGLIKICISTYHNPYEYCQTMEIGGW